jgi:hypothetical protein
MRPYGLEHTTITTPDKADLKDQARKSSVGHLAGKGGEFRSHFRRTADKRATRRTIRRRARAAGRADIARALRAD